MNRKKEIWDCSPEEMCRGYEEGENEFSCLLCGASFEKERVWPEGDQLYTAKGAVVRHIWQEHGDFCDWILQKNADKLGVSDSQHQLLQCMSRGMSDREIATEMGIALSTVRNHRFRLREKEKQCRLFLGMMQSLQEKTCRPIRISDQGELCEAPLTAAMVDDRYGITEAERVKTLSVCFDENGALHHFPAKEKKKIIVLRKIMENFSPGKTYTEKEVNRVLRRIYADYATLRRSLIEYGLMERTPNGSVYRVKE